MRAGFALPTVLFVLAMTSALVVAGAFATRQLAATGLTEERSAALETAVEDALSAAVVGWDSVARSAQLVGTVEHLTANSVVGIQADTWITRIGPQRYWLVAESRTDARPSLRRRIGLILNVSRGVAVASSERAWSELP
jgi:hypothetical protein